MADESTVTVRVRQGELRGRRRRTVWGFAYASFQGIPYAQPPVGPLRFKPPQPAKPWSGVLDATKHGSIAPQRSFVSGQYEGDEDCLFLNVYTPDVSNKGPSGLLPVMFMVHGGGLMGMSGNDDFFGPDFLIPHGVVLVTINYRLGVLGFLSTGDNAVPGNMGFKDQVMALRWVKENIRIFGGDPDNVTVFGESAGGWSTHALALSPLAKGLFHRAMPQSGVAVGDGVFSEQVRARSFALGAHLGLKTNDSNELVEFLRKQPAKVLQESAVFGRTEEDKARGWIFPFVGAIEPPDAEGGAFMPRHPTDIMLSGDFQPVPMTIGVCDFEGIVIIFAMVMEKDLLDKVANNTRMLIPTNLFCPDADKDKVAEEIKQFYFGDKKIGPDTLKEFCDVYGDTMFTYPAVKSAKVHSSKSEQPVFFYNFDVSREQKAHGQFMEQMSKYVQKFKATGHGADLAFQFHGNMSSEVPEQDSEDGKLIKTICRLFTNFAKTGRPTDADLDVSWPQFTAQDSAYLYVGRKGLTEEQLPFKDRIAFWENLYSRYGP